VLPRWPRRVVAAVVTAFALHGLPNVVYAPNHKADWRSAAAWIRERGDRAVVVVHAGDPRFVREPMEAARYYLGPDVVVEPSGEAGESRRLGAIVYHAHGVGPDWTPPAGETVAARFHGLTITKAVSDGAIREVP